MGSNPFQAPVEGLLDWINVISLSLGIISLMFIGYRFWRGRMSLEDAFAWAIGAVFVFGARPFVTAFQAWGQGI